MPNAARMSIAGPLRDALARLLQHQETFSVRRFGRFLPAPESLLLQLPIEALQLLLTFLFRALLPDLRLGPPRPLVVCLRRGLNIGVLPVMQLLLPLALVDFQPPKRLLLARVRRRRLDATVVLQHAKLQLVLLLPTRLLVALQRPQRRVVTPCRRRKGQSREAAKR